MIKIKMFNLSENEFCLSDEQEKLIYELCSQLERLHIEDINKLNEV
jgi:hypothetical protein